MEDPNLKFLVRKVERCREDFGHWLGIEQKLKELQDALSDAAGKPNRSLLSGAHLKINDKIHGLLDYALSWWMEHDTSGGRRRTLEGLMKESTLFIMKNRFRRQIVSKLNEVINEYLSTSSSSITELEEETAFLKERVTDPGNWDTVQHLVGRDEDVKILLAVMHGFAQDDSDRRRATISQLFQSRNNTTWTPQDDVQDEDDLVGRDEDVNNLLAVMHGIAQGDPRHFIRSQAILNMGIHIIPIVGTMGIGKTAVAQMLFHRADADCFHERIWVHVSPLFDCRRLLRCIADKIGYSDQQQEQQQEEEEEAAAEKNIVNFLNQQMRGKRYLLVLDDFWNEDRNDWGILTQQLSVLALATEKEGNTIIITTRSRILGYWDYQRLPMALCYELKGLSTDDSWRLLSRWLLQKKKKNNNHQLLLSSFPESDDDDDVKKALLERCCGVPAAIHALATYIDSCTTRSEGEGKLEALLNPNFRFLSVDEDDSCWLLPSRPQKVDDEQLSSNPEVDVNKTLTFFERCCRGVPAAIFYASAKYIKSCTSSSRKDNPEPPLVTNSSGKMGTVVINNRQLLYSFCLSYQLLFPSYLRNCFLFCSLLPEDHIYHKKEIGEIWIALGYTWNEYDKIYQLANRRSDYDETNIDQFANLWGCCFVPKMESSSSSSSSGAAYRIQPLMYELSRYLTWRDMPQDKDMAPQSLHLPLLVHPGTSAFPLPKDLPKTLRTLILLREAQMVLSHRRCEISVIPEDSLARLNHLRVLDLQCTMIKKLPRGIGKLLHLRYLNLSESDITNLPPDIGKLRSLMFLKLNKCRRLQKLNHAVTNLVELRTLDLSETDITNLPRGISKLRRLNSLKLKNCRRLRKLNDAVTNLISLRTLDLSGCWRLVEVPESMENLEKLKCLNIKDCSSLDRMPRDLGKLGRLRRLPRYIVGQTDGRTISELGNLDGLEGELRLDNLEKVLNIGDASNVDPHWMDTLESLALAWKWDDAEMATDAQRSQQEAVLEVVLPAENLIKLEIISYLGHGYPSWMSEWPYLTSLEEIRLFNLKGCQTLPPLGVLPRLKMAEISGMDAVIEVDGAFYGGAHGGTFPSLQKLTFSQMLKLEKWLDVNRGTNTFPQLTNLTIINCPRLVALEMPLPSVTELTMWLNNDALLYSSSKDCGLKGLAATLKKLSISLCHKLEALPDWLLDFTSLRSLSISGCYSLRSIPDGLRQRPGLNIDLEGCPAAAAADV